jgi:PAS domain S-box-containing protein
MDIVDPTVLLLLDPVLEQLNGLDGLKATADWQGQILEGRWQDTAPTWSGAGAAVSLELPDVIVLDHSYLERLGRWLEALNSSVPPDLVVLLETPDETLAEAALESGAQDFLVRSQLQGTRLRCTIQNLWQQRQLRQQLEVCRRQSGQTTRNESPRGTAAHSGALADDAEASPPPDINPPSLRPELLDSQAHLANILNHSNACICSLRLFPDLTWEYDYNSRGSETVYGYVPEFLTENPLLWASRVYPEDFEQVLKPALEGILAGEPVHHVEFRFVHRNGAVRWISETCNAHWHEGQQCWVVTTVAVDISDLKGTQASLQQAYEQLHDQQAKLETFNQALTATLEQLQMGEEALAVQNEELVAARHRAELERQRLQTITDSIPGCISYVDAEQRYRFVNRTYEEWFDCQKADLLGRTVEDVLGPTAYRQALPYIETVFSGQVTTYELKLTYGDGESRFVSGILVPDFDAGGLVDGYYALITDITDRKQAEAKIGEISQRLALATHAAQIGIWDFDLIQDRIIWDDRMYAIYGVPPGASDENFESWKRCLHPDDWLRIQPDAQAAIAGERDYHVEFRVVRPDGQIRFVEAHAVVTRNEAEVPQRLIGVNLDVTDRIHTEQALQRLNEELEQRVLDRTTALQESQTLNRQILESIPDLLIWMNADGTCIKMAGGNNVMLIASTSESINQNIADHLPADIVDRRMQFLGEALRTQEIQMYEQQVSYGELIEYEEVRVVPVAEDRALMLIRNITDRKQAEAALRESEARFRATFEQAAVGIVRSDLDGHLIELNQKFCDILGYTEAELFRKHFSEITHPEDVAVDQANLNRLLAGEISNYMLEKRFLKPDGQEVWANLAVSAVRNSTGEPEYYIAVIQDISERCQAEQQLKSERMRLEVALEAAQMGTWESDLETEKWSERAEAIFGYTPGTFPGTREAFLELIHPEDHDQMLAALPESIANQVPYHREYRVYRPDGELRWLASDAAIIDTEKESGLGIVGVVRDITERKLAEQALRESEERLQLAQEAAQMGSWDWNMLTNQVIWSESLEKLMGLEPGSFDGQFETISAMIHPDDWQRVMEALGRSIDQDEPYDMEFRFVKPDGSIRWAASKATVLRDPEGRVIRMTGMDVDITDRKHLEAEQTRLLSILEASPDHIGMAKPDGTVLWNNRQAKLLSGLPLDVDVTQIPVSAYHPQWAIEVLQQEAFPAVMRDGIWVGETALLNPQGGEIPVSQLILAHRSASGEVEYLSTIIRDISSLKQAEQTLRKVNLELEARVAERTAELQEAKEAAESANQAKSIFLANMSHELRTPLNAILGFSQLMVRDKQLSEHHQRELGIINRSGKHLLTLINDILEMSKIEVGLVTLHPTSFCLAQFLEELTTMLRFKAEAKDLTFSALYPTHLNF